MNPAEPIFTPSTKAETGRQEHLVQQMVDDRAEHFGRTEDKESRCYRRAPVRARKGVIIADTKSDGAGRGEFGELILVDEVGTPDSFVPRLAWRHPPPAVQTRSRQEHLLRHEASGVPNDWLEMGEVGSRIAPARREPRRSW